MEGGPWRVATGANSGGVTPPPRGLLRGDSMTARGVLTAVKPLLGFREMSQVLFLGSRLELFGRNNGCHAAIRS